MHGCMNTEYQESLPTFSDVVLCFVLWYKSKQLHLSNIITSLQYLPGNSVFLETFTNLHPQISGSCCNIFYFRCLMLFVQWLSLQCTFVTNLVEQKLWRYRRKYQQEKHLSSTNLGKEKNIVKNLVLRRWHWHWHSLRNGTHWSKTSAWDGFCDRSVFQISPFKVNLTGAMIIKSIIEL